MNSARVSQRPQFSALRGALDEVGSCTTASIGEYLVSITVAPRPETVGQRHVPRLPNGPASTFCGHYRKANQDVLGVPDGVPAEISTTRQTNKLLYDNRLHNILALIGFVRKYVQPFCR